MRKPESPIETFKLERYFARWEFVAPYLLCTSDVEGYALQDLLALADDESLKLWQNLGLGYTESLGHPLLRVEIAKIYKTVTSDQVICFAGAEEAMYIAMRVLLKPGDHLISTFPGYQSSYQIAEDMGVTVSKWAVRPALQADGHTEWKVDLEELKGLIRPNTRMILVNFPHNPTGALPTQAEWQQIIAVAKEAGCYLFSDEVYRLLEYDPANRLSAAVDEYERGLSLGVMSKPFGLAGLRIGWLAVKDTDLFSAMAGYKDYTTICNSAPSEILALIGLRAKEVTLGRSLDLIRKNLALAEQTLAELHDFFEWLPPKAGSIAFPRWKGPGSVEAFTDALVQKEGVLLLPGTVYDAPGEHFRLGLGRKSAPEALARLKRYIAAL